VAKTDALDRADTSTGVFTDRGHKVTVATDNIVHCCNLYQWFGNAFLVSGRHARRVPNRQWLSLQTFVVISLRRWKQVSDYILFKIAHGHFFIPIQNYLALFHSKLQVMPTK
jgi:hypothetical protein